MLTGSRLAGRAVAVGTAAGTLLLGTLAPVAAEEQLETKGKASAKHRVKHGGLPHIGKIGVRKAAPGKYVATVPVSHVKVLAAGHPREMKESTEVSLVVHRALYAQGRPTKTVNAGSSRAKVLTSGTTTFAIPLKPKAARWLMSVNKKQRKKLLVATVTHKITNADHVGTPGHHPATHFKIASSSWAHSGGKPKGRSELALRAGGDGDDSRAAATVSLINGTNEDVQIMAMPTMCMYDYGQRDSNVAQFNAQQGAALRPGGTIEGYLEGDSDLTSKAKYSGPPPVSVGNKGMKIFDYAFDQASKFVNKQFDPTQVFKGTALSFVPVGAILESALGVLDSCGRNASTFQFTAIGNKSLATAQQAWVLSGRSEKMSKGTIRGPLYSLDAAATYQKYSTQSLLDAPSGWWTRPSWWGEASNKAFAAYLGKNTDLGQYFNRVVDVEETLSLTLPWNKWTAAGENTLTSKAGINSELIGFETKRMAGSNYRITVKPGRFSNVSPENCCLPDGRPGTIGIND